MIALLRKDQSLTPFLAMLVKVVAKFGDDKTMYLQLYPHTTLFDNVQFPMS